MLRLSDDDAKGVVAEGSLNAPRAKRRRLLVYGVLDALWWTTLLPRGHALETSWAVTDDGRLTTMVSHVTSVWLCSAGSSQHCCSLVTGRISLIAECMNSELVR